MIEGANQSSIVIRISDINNKYVNYVLGVRADPVAVVDATLILVVDLAVHIRCRSDISVARLPLGSGLRTEVRFRVVLRRANLVPNLATVILFVIMSDVLLFRGTILVLYNSHWRSLSQLLQLHSAVQHESIEQRCLRQVALADINGRSSAYVRTRDIRKHECRRVHANQTSAP